MPTTDRTHRIRQLNDELRRSNKQGTMFLTQGVAALSPTLQATILTALASFHDFTADNDPHGEHDFGAFAVEAHRLLFKIDYYDLADRCHSPDPADPAVTHRVLTVMLAEEY